MIYQILMSPTDINYNPKLIIFSMEIKPKSYRYILCLRDKVKLNFGVKIYVIIYTSNILDKTWVLLSL